MQKNEESIPPLNERGQGIAIPKNTNPPPMEAEDWEQRLRERPWVIKGTIWDSRGRWCPDNLEE
jgi:hypothetical protein